MQIRLNGEVHEVRDEASLCDVIESLGLVRRRVAIELNRDIVPRECFETTRLAPGDVVEVVQLVGGG